VVLLAALAVVVGDLVALGVVPAADTTRGLGAYATAAAPAGAIRSYAYEPGRPGRSAAHAGGVVAPTTLVQGGYSNGTVSGGSGPGVPTGPTRPAGGSAATGATAPGVYRVDGTTIVAPTGRSFTPYGMTVYGLAENDWQANISSDEAAIAATASYWHGNTMRIQVAPSNLFSTSPYSQAFLAAIQQEVADAESHGLNVILCAQTERTDKAVQMPNSTVEDFWRVVAPRYADDSRVWFDLFNEPRLSPQAVGGMASLWNVWQNGGDGYVGMQSLINTIRADGASNIVLAEGTLVAESLTLLPSHMLSGANIVYDVHPYFSGPGWDTPRAWTNNWGFLVGKVPVVIGEWAQSASAHRACLTDAPTVVPQFLAYVAAHSLGLIAWGLIPGVLLQSDNLEDPTTYTPGEPYTCGSAHTPGLQGAGTLIRAFFAARSQAAPA
jgi:hypothetical protein